jgi:hypothetical protein
VTDQYDKLINGLLESDRIKKIYDEYIIKDITFKEWVIGYTDDMLRKQYAERSTRS